MFLKKMFEGKSFNSFGWNPIEPLNKKIHFNGGSRETKTQ